MGLVTSHDVSSPHGRSESVVVREPRLPEENDRIVDLFAETVRWHADHWPRDIRALTTDHLGAELSKLAERDASVCLLVAVVDDAVVGLITATLSPAPTGGLNRYEGPVVHVGDVVVTESARRQGVGSRLMVAVEQWARERAAATVILTVHAGNDAAESLYAARGYRATDVAMRKDL
jgi:GNAT superfamily N-acetyltransferase